MSPIRATEEDARFAKQLNRLDRFNHLISAIAAAVVARNDEFERVWSIANQIYDRHCPPNLRFMPGSQFDEARRTALSAYI